MTGKNSFFSLAGMVNGPRSTCVSVAQHATLSLDVSWPCLQAEDMLISRSRLRAVPALAALLRERRLEKKLSLRQATSGVPGISASTLCRVEAGERNLTFGPGLLALADRLELDRQEVLDLAGGLTVEGIDELLGADLRLAVRGGRLVHRGREALREAHLAALAARGGGASVELLANEMDLDFRPALEEPGFDGPEVYRVPRAEGKAVQRMWKAHGVAHAWIAADAGGERSCRPHDTATASEREATYLGRRLLLPTAVVHAAHRELGVPEPRDADELSDMVRALVAELHAPAGWVVVRLAEEGLVGVTT